MSFIDELKRRNVIRMAGLYLVGAWFVVQVAGTVLPMFAAPEWMPRTLVVLLAVGFVPAMVFSWVFEITPEGLKRESQVDRSQSITPHTGKKLERIILIVFAVALAYFAFDKFALAPRRDAVMRQQTAVEVAAARKEGGVDALIHSYGDHSIAVLPFVDMSVDKGDAFFGDGISEDLMNLLAKVPQLRVIARTSSFSFKDKDVDVPEIAKKLRVAHVLEGSVRTSGARVRITVQLIDAQTDTQMWSESYDRNSDDLQAVQDEIAAAVVAQLKLKMLAAVPAARKTDPRVHSLNQQAIQLARLRTPEGYEQSYALLQKALKIDPNDPLAWDSVAYYYVAKSWAGLMPSAEANKLARRALAKALAADPNFAQAHARLGELAMAEGDLPAAAEHIQHALALDPSDPIAIGISSELLALMGRTRDATAAEEYCAAIDPANPIAQVNMGISVMEEGRYAEAIPYFRTALALTPGRGSALDGLAKALLLAGQPKEALPVIAQIKDKDLQTHYLAMAYHAMGKRKESDAELAKLTAKWGKQYPSGIAEIVAFRGETDRAFALLDQAVAVKEDGLTAMVTEAQLISLHKDPRWLPFLRKIGRSPEQMASIKFEVKLPDAGTAQAM